jgi:hypothetical protein
MRCHLAKSRFSTVFNGREIEPTGRTSGRETTSAALSKHWGAHPQQMLHGVAFRDSTNGMAAPSAGSAHQA